MCFGVRRQNWKPRTDVLIDSLKKSGTTQGMVQTLLCYQAGRGWALTFSWELRSPTQGWLRSHCYFYWNTTYTFHLTEALRWRRCGDEQIAIVIKSLGTRAMAQPAEQVSCPCLLAPCLLQDAQLAILFSTPAHTSVSRLLPQKPSGGYYTKD